MSGNVRADGWTGERIHIIRISSRLLIHSKAKLKIEINSLIKKIYTNRMLFECVQFRRVGWHSEMCNRMHEGLELLFVPLSLKMCHLIEFILAEMQFITHSILILVRECVCTIQWLKMTIDSP